MKDLGKAKRIIQKMKDYKQKIFNFRFTNCISYETVHFTIIILHMFDDNQPIVLQ